MQIPVKITLQSTIVDVTQDEPQRIHYSCDGMLSVDGSRYQICYKEGELTEMGNTTTTLFYDTQCPDLLVLGREGDVSCSLSFSKENPRHLCTYSTPFGPFAFTVVTKELFCQLSQATGRIRITYSIEIQGTQAELNRLHILITPKKEE